MKILYALLVATGFSFSANSATIFVDVNATGANSGLNWADAYVDLQDAITLSTFGDEIWVAQGTYKPTTGTTRSANFSMKNGVKVYGGFVGGETLLSQRDPELNVTVLSGEIGTGSASDNSYVVTYFNNVANQTRLDGFTITGGYHSGVSAYGGGAKVVASSPTIANCKFQGNYAEDGGGAIDHSTSGILTLDNCLFDGNVGNTYGGGALRLYSATVNISDCYFKSNQSDTYGGAIYIYDAIVNISRSVFAGNISQTSGSAIRIGDAGTIHMDNSLVVGNYTNTTGTITTSTFSNTSSHEIINCTIAHNKQDNSSGSSTNSAVSLNDEATISNSIIYGNQSTNQVLSTGLTFNYNLTEISTNNATGTEILYTDPQFILPGDVSAAPFDTTGLNYHLGILSEAIDFGENASVVGANDLAGSTRITNSVVDLGAFEEAYCVSSSQFTTSAPYTICGGTSISLEIDNAVDMQWSTGSTSNPINVTSAGTYSVILEDGSGCRGVLSADVTSSANPTPSITYSGGNLDAGTYSSYQWYYNGGIINGATNNTHIPIEGYGLYEVIVQNSGGCEGSAEYCLSPAALNTDGPTVFCEGNDVTLSVTDGDSYVWSTGSLSSSITVNSSDNYSVTVFNSSANCSVLLEQDIVVNANPNPIINFDGLNLSTSSFTSYQWYFNGTPISGATSQSLNAYSFGNGQYTVTVTNSNGCEGTSSVYNLSNLGLNENELFEVKCYPNPTNGPLIVESNEIIEKIEVFNSLGQIVLTKDCDTKNSLALDLPIENGIYYLKITSGNRVGLLYVVRQ